MAHTKKMSCAQEARARARTHTHTESQNLRETLKEEMEERETERASSMCVMIDQCASCIVSGIVAFPDSNYVVWSILQLLQPFQVQWQKLDRVLAVIAGFRSHSSPLLVVNVVNGKIGRQT